MIFFIVFSCILFSIYAYVGWKFILTLKIALIFKQILLIILFIFYCLPILGFVLQAKKIENLASILISWLGYMGLGVISLFFFYHIAVDILFSIKNIVIKGNDFDPNRRAFLGLSAKALAGTVAGFSSIWGFYSGLKSPIIERVEVPIKDLPSDLVNFTIAHITDTHVGRMIGVDFIEEVVEKIEKMNPDILVFTGDAADGSVESFGKALKPFSKINPPHGKYFVTGNHEYYSDLNGWLNLIEKVGFKILINESQILNINDSTLMITGLPDRSGGHFSSFHKTDMVKALGGMNSSDVKILLAHQPKDIEYATKYGFDLQLSGHTHGGQYFPFSILVGLAHPFIKGLYKRDETWVYINQGTGYWGPPMRIGTEPEITQILLV